MSIAAGVAALQDTVFQAKLPGLEVISGAVNFVLVCCDVSVTQLQEHLLKQHKILIRDCVSFPELGDRYFRVAVRTIAENERLLAALSTALQEE